MTTPGVCPNDLVVPLRDTDVAVLTTLEEDIPLGCISRARNPISKLLRFEIDLI